MLTRFLSSTFLKGTLRRWLVALALTLPIMQAARAEEGFYLAILGGMNIVHDADLNEFGFFIAPDGTAEFDANFLYGAALGFQSNGSWRAELELTVRENDFDRVFWDRTGKTGSFLTTGDISATALLVNSVWDIDVDSRILPTFGFGVGMARLKLDNVADTSGPLFDDTDFSLAGQIIFGIKVLLTESISGSVEYRYFISRVTSNVANGQPAIGGERMTMGYSNSAFLLSVRYQF